MYEEAIAEFQRTIELSRGNAAFDSNLAYAYAASGRRDQALKIAKDLETRYGQHSSADAISP
jgi:Flp pilus assembly protein TadD